MIITCQVCGLRNSGGETNCRRCSEPLIGSKPSAPARSLFGRADGDVWREGDILVLRKGASLPDRCVLCGGPAETRIDHTYYWHSPGFYAFILLNILVYAVVAMAVRKRADVQLPLCSEHAAKRRRGVQVAMGTAFLPGLYLLIGALSARAIGKQGISLTVSEPNFIHLRGVDTRFLERQRRWDGYIEPTG